MVKKSGLTEENMLNRRFCKTEKAILDAFFRARHFSSVRLIARKAGISRSTFYRHHKAIYNVMSDYERYILNKYAKILRKTISKKDVGVRVIYRQMLIFIMVNKAILLVLIKNNNGDVLKKMVRKLEASVVRACKWPDKSEKMFEVYVSEISGVVEGWGKESFSEGKMEEVLGDIMYLTETARKRLLPLEN